MSRTWRAVASLVAAGLLAAGCTLPGRVGGPVEVVAVFDDVADLVVEHAVQVADVRIGSVTRIELTDDYRARVTMSIQEGLDLPADMVAVLRQTSLLGEKFIELRPFGEADAAACPEVERPAGDFSTGGEIACTQRAPELEVVAEAAVELLSVVAQDSVSDLAAIIRTGGEGFGGRTTELRGLIDSLATISSTLSSQTGNLLAIIDGLDGATATLAAGAPELDTLLVNLADTTQLLADDREQAVATLEQLTRLARVQNQLIFVPYLEATTRQIEQIDAILQVVTDGRGEVGALVDWLAEFVRVTPLAIPCRPPASATEPCVGGDFAQIYGLIVPLGNE
ncbi:MAG: MCE family protein [Acidimicrobiia bacterium]|nr:MCE family protein [Acidimicrobiia bacterium]